MSRKMIFYKTYLEEHVKISLFLFSPFTMRSFGLLKLLTLHDQISTQTGSLYIIVQLILLTDPFFLRRTAYHVKINNLSSSKIVHTLNFYFLLSISFSKTDLEFNDQYL